MRFQGLLRAPTLNAAPLLGWKIQQLPLDSKPRFTRFPSFVPRIPPPAFYSGDFILNGPVRDTFVSLKGWGKVRICLTSVNIVVNFIF